jgi:alkylated DNA repair dioxygenase AlkB
MGNPGHNKEYIDLQLKDAEVLYYPNFFNKSEADNYLDILLKELHWEQHNIKIFGKSIPQPRLTSLYGISKQSYSYSNLLLEPHKYTPSLLKIHKGLKRATSSNFSHCLANLYRDGSDSMGWHSDDEKPLGNNPVIASISFGAVRSFQLKHKEHPELKHKIDLAHGSLLIMKGETQKNWKHQLPKTKKTIGPRINLTFRNILET